MKAGSTEYKTALILSYVIGAVLILLPFHAFFTSWAANNFNHLDLFRIWKELILALITPPVLYLGWKKEATRQFLKNSWIVRLFIFYILLHVVLGGWALAHHDVNRTALIYSFIINLRFIGFFILVLIVASYNDFLQRHLIKIIIIPAVIVIVFGVAQEFVLPMKFMDYFYGGNTIPPFQTIDGNTGLQRIQSTLRGANPLGAYLVLALTVFAAFIKRRPLRWVSLLGGFTLLFYSYSRSAWLGTLIALWLLSWWTALKSHHKTWLISSIFVIVLLVGGMFYLFKNSSEAQNTFLHTSSQSKSTISSNEARRIALKSGIHDVVHQPLGGGPGTAGPASFRNKPHGTRIAENYYLQIGQEVGVIGMATFITINIFVARELWLRRQDLRAHVLLASLAGISFINLVSHAWTDDTLSLLWWGLAGITLAPAIMQAGNSAHQNGKKQKSKT
jgi:hypothetical protein